MSEAVYLSVARSWLFVPGDRPERIAKALASAAHAVIIDLEDAVPASGKADARDTVRNMLADVCRPGIHVRINAIDSEFAFDDIAAVAGSAIAGIMLPKAERARDIQIADWLLSRFERQAGAMDHQCAITPLVETAAGFADLAAIAAASPRVKRLAFGAADFTLDMGLVCSPQEQELAPFRAALVLASRAAGIEAPIDTPWLDIGDREGGAAASSRSRAAGFQGKLCIHPAQIEAVHDAFAPSPAAVQAARRVVEAFQAAGETAVKADGKMIDRPVVEAALRILANGRETAACCPTTSEGGKA